MGQPTLPPLIIGFLVAASTSWSSASPTPCPPTLAGVKPAIVSCPHTKGGLLPVLTSDVGSDTRSPGSVLIILPDDTTSAENTFEKGVSLVEDIARETSNTLVLAVPAMGMTKDCSPKHWLNESTEKEWQGLPTHWTGLQGIDCLDGVVQWAEDQFPNLRSISVLGLAEGGERVHRWSLVSGEGESGRTGRGTELRILVAAPSTFPYPRGVRPADSCMPRVTTSGHRCKDFVRSEEGVHCDGGSPHFTDGNDLDTEGRHAKRMQEPANASLTVFSSKVVNFLFGIQDTDACSGKPCEGACSAAWQGSSRLQRGLNYMGFLEESLSNYEAQFELFDLSLDSSDILKTPAVQEWVVASGIHTVSGSAMFARQLASKERVNYWYESTDRAVQEAGLHLASYSDKRYSVVECESLCDIEAACNSFTYDSKRGHCSLRSKCVAADELLVSADDHRAHLKTFFRPCTRQGYMREDAAARNHWVITKRVIKEEGGVWRGGSAPFQKGSVEHCKAVCVKDPLCNSFSFGHGGCYLKAKCVTPSEEIVDEDAHNADFKTYYLPCEKRDDGLQFYETPHAGPWAAPARSLGVAIEGDPQFCPQQPCPSSRPVHNSSIMPMIAIAFAALGPALTVLLVCANAKGPKKEQSKPPLGFKEGRTSAME